MRIEARGVGKRFGRLRALADVSFDLPAGSRVALVGPNGSGKSTLDRILMGLVACEGSVRIDGRCPFRERVAVAHRMAYVPQVAPQLAAPVGEVVRAIASVRGLGEGEVATLAEQLDLDIAALARRPFRSLSGGTKQKLLLALAFASRASLLILDEPTGSLDARARERFFALFETVAPQTTLVLCSHRLEEIRPLVAQVLMLEDGRLVHEGPVQAFLGRSALATIDAWVRGETAERWLAARGFQRSPAGVWRRTLDATGKRRLLIELVRELGPSLLDVDVRDLDALEVTPRDGGHARG